MPSSTQVIGVLVQVLWVLLAVLVPTCVIFLHYVRKNYPAADGRDSRGAENLFFLDREGRVWEDKPPTRR